MTIITAAKWKLTALENFKGLIASATGKPIETIEVHLRDHPETAAVTWQGLWGGGLAITLYMPTMLPGAKLTARDQDTLAGYWLHEALHVLHTDKAAWDRACQRSQAFARIVNGLEDCRMECNEIACFGDRTPGAKKVLKAITERAVWNGPCDHKTVNRKQNLAAVLAYLGRDMIGGYDLSQAPAMRKALSPDNAKIVAAILARTKDAKDTNDIVQIVDDILSGGHKVDAPATEQQEIPPELQDLLNEIPDDFEQLDNDSTQGEGEQGEGEQGEGEGEGEQGEGEGEQNGKAGADQSDDQNGKAGADQSDDFGDVSDRDSMSDADPSSVTDEIANRVNDREPTHSDRKMIAGADGMTRVDTSRRDKTPAPRHGDTHWGSETFESLEQKLPDTGTMAINVRRMVKAADRKGWKRRVNGGRLDMRQPSRIKQGFKDVYKVTNNHDGHTASVGLVLDGSGSMMEMADWQTAMALAVMKAVEAAGAPVEAHAFISHAFCKIKGFDQKVSQRKAEIVGASHVGGGTPLAHSILAGGISLMESRADRRILVCLTDGQDSNGRDYVGRAVRMVQDMGVEVVGIVTTTSKSESPADFGLDVCNAFIASHPHKLGGAVLGQIVTMLERSRK